MFLQKGPGDVQIVLGHQSIVIFTGNKVLAATSIQTTGTYHLTRLSGQAFIFSLFLGLRPGHKNLQILQLLLGSIKIKISIKEI